VGLSVDIENADVAPIRAAASSLLDQDSYRRAGAGWREEMLRLAPMEDSVDLLLQLAGEGRDRADAGR
jgi:hypothetical protein